MDVKEKKFQTDVEYRIYRILHFAKKHGWSKPSLKNNLLEFEKQSMALTVDIHEFKILSSLMHPRWGKTLLLRKGDFTQQIIESIFRNPRQHMKREKIGSEYVK